MHIIIPAVLVGTFATVEILRPYITVLFTVIPHVEAYNAPLIYPHTHYTVVHIVLQKKSECILGLHGTRSNLFQTRLTHSNQLKIPSAFKT